MRVGVLCNGSVEDYTWLETKLTSCQFVICADGGSNHAYRIGFRPDLIVGDLDSIEPAVLEHFLKQGVNIQRYPVEKDDTDQRIALIEAIKQGATEILMLGCLGKRIDHTLGSLSMLAYLHAQGVPGIVMDEHNEITLREKEAIIEGEMGQEVSLLPLTSSVTGITTENLQYALQDAVFELGNPYGISNVLTTPKARVTMSGGLLLVIKSKDVDGE